MPVPAGPRTGTTKLTFRFSREKDRSTISASVWREKPWSRWMTRTQAVAEWRLRSSCPNTAPVVFSRMAPTLTVMTDDAGHAVARGMVPNKLRRRANPRCSAIQELTPTLPSTSRTSRRPPRPGGCERWDLRESPGDHPGGCCGGVAGGVVAATRAAARLPPQSPPDAHGGRPH